MIHEMKLHPQPFDMIASGEKTIELRLHDEKRQRIQIGDRIRFTNSQDPARRLEVLVTNLYHFCSFAQLYDTLPLEKCGYRPEEVKDASYKDMEQYYSMEEQAKYGVLGIEIKLCGERSMEVLKFGILSTSSIAPRFIAALRESGVGKAAALSSRTLEKALEKAAAWDIPKAYGSHMELLNDAAVDIVYISAVNSQHYPLAKAALEHGKHVICEKPCTTSAAHTRELFTIAREKGLFLMEAEKMLFLPALLEVRRRIADGCLGEITMAEMSHSFSASYNAWMFDPAVGGGPLLSSGIYAVHLLIWLFGGIEEIRGIRGTMENGVEWQYVLTGSAKSGVLFNAKNSTRAILDNTARIYGTKGWVEIPEYWKARKAIFYIPGKEPEVVEFPCQHELVYEVQHIAECFAQGLPASPVVTEELSVAGIEALEQVKNTWK